MGVVGGDFGGGWEKCVEGYVVGVGGYGFFGIG